MAIKHPCRARAGGWQGGVSLARVEVGAGTVRLEDGTLAGSLSTLDQSVRLAVRHLDLTPAEATRLVTLNPARLLRLRTRGEVVAGRTADLVLLDRRLRVQATWLRGELAWARRRRLPLLGLEA